MRERPILFAGPMVRAILSGEKTVTRRVMKPQPTVTETYLREREAWVDGLTLSDHVNNAWQSGFIDVPCPYGEPGDRLWVRETYGDAGCRLTYRADLDDGAHCMVKRWIPSIHMPRSASRILLEITAVRVERLQDISEDQAKAEGLRWHSLYKQWGGLETHPASRPECPQWRWYESPITAFRQLWASINGAESWDANTWVWVVEFKRITP